MRLKSILFGVLVVFASLQLLQTAPVYGNYRGVRVVPVRPTPESETVVLKLIFPRPYENRESLPVNVQMRLEGYPLGTMSQFDRANQIYNHPEGQSVHVFIDHHPYFVYNQSVEDSFDENREFYDKILSFPVPFDLERGEHRLRCFPVRSYGESLKGEGCFQSGVFYVQDPLEKNHDTFDPQRPCLTYNEPQGRYPAGKSDPILLDFYLTNCQLSADGYQVRLSVDGKVIRTLTRWIPYYIYGLKQGTHQVKLELLGKDRKVVAGSFNEVEREIVIN